MCGRLPAGQGGAWPPPGWPEVRGRVRAGQVCVAASPAGRRLDITEAKRVIHSHGTVGAALASRLGRCSKIRNGVCHPDKMRAHDIGKLLSNTGINQRSDSVDCVAATAAGKAAGAATAAVATSAGLQHGASGASKVASNLAGGASIEVVGQAGIPRRWLRQTGGTVTRQGLPLS